jgi:hypothetical protein
MVATPPVFNLWLEARLEARECPPPPDFQVAWVRPPLTDEYESQPLFLFFIFILISWIFLF